MRRSDLRYSGPGRARACRCLQSSDDWLVNGSRSKASSVCEAFVMAHPPSRRVSHSSEGSSPVAMSAREVAWERGVSLPPQLILRVSIWGPSYSRLAELRLDCGPRSEERGGALVPMSLVARTAQVLRNLENVR